MARRARLHSVHTKTRKTPIHCFSSKRDISTKMGDIEAALEALELSDRPNITHITKEYGVHRSTLSRRARGLIMSREKYRENWSLLTNQQSKTLILYINRLYNRGIPSTPAMTRHFAKDITTIYPGKSWILRWIKANSNKLSSDFLASIDLSRHKADN